MTLRQIVSFLSFLCFLLNCDEILWPSNIYLIRGPLVLVNNKHFYNSCCTVGSRTTEQTCSNLSLEYRRVGWGQWKMTSVSQTTFCKYFYNEVKHYLSMLHSYSQISFLCVVPYHIYPEIPEWHFWNLRTVLTLKLESRELANNLLKLFCWHSAMLTTAARVQTDNQRLAEPKLFTIWPIEKIFTTL